MAAKPQPDPNQSSFHRAPVLDVAAMAPDGLLHKFGITQDQHCVEIVPTMWST